MRNIYKMLLILAAVLLTPLLISCEKEDLGNENTLNGGTGLNGGTSLNGGTGLSSGNKINGHEYVDLGLPSGLKWATCNVGASSPEEYGNYYAWGETTTKSTYTEGNSLTYGKTMSDISGNATYDAARANWGSTWRMPTLKEMKELKNNCTWTWTSQSGYYGYKITGVNGNSIFLPAAGFRYGSSLYYVGEHGLYWNSTPTEIDVDCACCLDFGSNYCGWSGSSRSHGMRVRPVSD